jgi:hypothetical protein
MTYRPKYGNEPGAWQSGFDYGSEAARHETRTAARKTLAQLHASARTDFDRGQVAGYEAALGITRVQAKLHHATKPKRRKSRAQLEREIAQNLTSSGQPQLASLFADPEATRVFAEEMRKELYKKQAAEKGAAFLAARPYTVKRLELMGNRRLRSLFGRYATETEARAKADKVDGWVEYEGQVIYGTEKQSDPASES